jgi:hypothetical protein
VCSCRDENLEDCAAQCPVRLFVDGVSGAVFFARADTMMGNPKERAAALSRFAEHLRAAAELLEPKCEHSPDGTLIAAEGKSEDLQRLDAVALGHPQRPIDEAELAGLQHSPAIAMLQRLANCAEAQASDCKKMPKARRRQPQQNLVEELARLWRDAFAELPSTVPSGAFSQVILEVSDRWYSEDALQSAIKRARKNLGSD